MYVDGVLDMHFVRVRGTQCSKLTDSSYQMMGRNGCKSHDMKFLTLRIISANAGVLLEASRALAPFNHRPLLRTQRNRQSESKTEAEGDD
jgi:hypothetical protein